MRGMAPPRTFVRMSAGDMCRHRGIGMNRAKKTKANPVELLEVKLLLRGFASELPPEPEPEHTALPPWALFFDLRMATISL